MAKGKNAHLASTRRSCKRSCGRPGARKGRTANAQTRRGLLEADDTLTRPESVISDDDEAASSGSDQGDKERTTPEPSGGSSPLSPLGTDVAITVPVAMWVRRSPMPTLFGPFDAVFYTRTLTTAIRGGAREKDSLDNTSSPSYASALGFAV